MTQLWDRGLILLLMLWTGRSGWLTAQLAEFVMSPRSAWLLNLALGLGWWSALALPARPRRV